VTAATAGSRPSLEPFAASWATLLGTRKRDGTWVDTPVNLAVHDGDGLGQVLWFRCEIDEGLALRERAFAGFRQEGRP
jgi:hypothetical protein